MSTPHTFFLLISYLTSHSAEGVTVEYSFNTHCIVRKLCGVAIIITLKCKNQNEK